jgi:hypothetical protein
VNAYTRILQRYFDEHGKEEVIVNSIHPGSFHSKISQVVLIASYIERTNTKFCYRYWYGTPPEVLDVLL